MKIYKSLNLFINNSISYDKCPNNLKNQILNIIEFIHYYLSISMVFS